MVKKTRKTVYTIPMVEVLLVRIERGFAGSFNVQSEITESIDAYSQSYDNNLFS